jgi:heme-degrading monooxygenase HmoA
MHASVRKYHVTDHDELTRRVKEDFVSIVREVDGFKAYYVVDSVDDETVTITIAESEEAVENSAAKAAEWLAADEERAALIKSGPEVTNGDITVEA